MPSSLSAFTGEVAARLSSLTDLPFLQNARLLTLRFADDAGLDADRLLPHRLTGEEHLSRCYRYTLSCLSADSFVELKDLLGQPVAIGILQADGETRTLCGIVTAARHDGGDGGFARYALTIEPALSTLAHRTNSRVFQDQSVPDIVSAVLQEHIAANPVFAACFRVESHLRQTYPARSYCLQYRESDLAFIERLLAEEGISYRFAFDAGEGSGGGTPVHTIILFDDWQSLDANDQERIRFHRADGTEDDDTITDWQGMRQLATAKSSLASFDYKGSTRHDGDADTAMAQGENGDALASTLERYDPQTLYYGTDPDDMARYANLRQQAADLAAKSFTGEGTARGLQAGTWFRLENHPVHEQDVAELREFIVTSLQVEARNNLLPDESAETNTPPYINRFTAIRRGIPLVPAYDAQRHAKPSARGPQTAIVTGPAGEEIFTDEHGRIKVQFHWQRQQDHADGGADFDERSSTWVRVAHASAGAGWGSQHIPRIGQEVVITFLEGDIDRPLCTGVVHNGTHATPAFSGAGSLPANKALSGIKSRELDGNGYNELLLDDTHGELRSKLSSEHAKTQLNQGYLIHPRTEGKGTPRGEGFELRTDAAGAIRAAKGLLIAAEAQASASGNQLARQALLQLLDSALALSEQLGEQAVHQHANQPEIGTNNQLTNDDAVPGKPSERGHQTHLTHALHNLERGSNTDPNGKSGSGSGTQSGGQQVVAISGPDGVAIASDQSITIAAATNLDQIAQRDLQQTTGRRWIHNVNESISLFVAGTKAKIADTFKLIAAKGNIQMQAQDGKIEATAQQDVTITSVNGRVVIQAPKEILLTAGGGYIRIGADIEIHNPGKQSQKAQSFSLAEPAQLTPALPDMPALDMPHTRKFVLQGLDGKPIDGAGITLFDPDEKVPTWSSEMPNGQSSPMPLQENSDRYAAVMGFKESVFHFHDAENHVFDEDDADAFEDQHHDRYGE
jgi:type VI secretion system secreted protein VgrG